MKVEHLRHFKVDQLVSISLIISLQNIKLSYSLISEYDVVKLHRHHFIFAVNYHHMVNEVIFSPYYLNLVNLNYYGAI